MSTLRLELIERAAQLIIESGDHELSTPRIMEALYAAAESRADFTDYLTIVPATRREDWLILGVSQAVSRHPNFEAPDALTLPQKIAQLSGAQRTVLVLLAELIPHLHAEDGTAEGRIRAAFALIAVGDFLPEVRAAAQEWLDWMDRQA